MARPAARAPCRTSTWPARTAWAPLGTPTSKVWYTVAGGMLSDVYYPTVDNTNVETLQYIVTDGATFTDLQARDMTYTVEAVTDTGGMACKVTASGQGRPVQHRDHLRHRPEPERRPDAARLHAQAQAQQHRSAAVRALRPDRERQWRRRRGQWRGGHGNRRRHERPSDPRGLRPGHRDQRRQPGLRPAGLRRPRRPVRRGFRRVRRLGERRPRAARRLPHADPDPSRRPRGQRRRDGAAGPRRQRQDPAGPRVRRDRRRGDRHGGRVAGGRLRRRPSMPTSPAGTPTTRR